MRDLREFAETVTSYFSSPGVVTQTPVSTIKSTHRIGSSGRDDSIATEPNDSGAYFKPTTYRGWFYGSTSYPADYFGRSIATAQNRRYWGRYTWSQLSSGLNTSTLVGCLVSNRPNVPTHITSSVESRLQNAINEGIWDIGQFLGELPETIDFIVESALDLVTLLAAVKSGRFRGYTFNKAMRRRNFRKFNPNKEYASVARARRRRETAKSRAKIESAKTASGAYLALMYGIIPLLDDIYNSILFLEQKVENLRNKTSNAFASAAEPIPFPQINVGVKLIDLMWKGEVGCKADVHWKVKTPSLASLDSMGLLSPLSLAWELFPLSFVVDWFIPIGAFISGLSGHWGVIFSHGYRTRYAKWNAQANFSVAAIFDGGSPARISGNLLSFERQEYIGFPIPIPYLKGLDFSVVETYSKAVSLIALGIQRIT